MAELTKLHVIDNTYIFYTSDHGYQLGQLRLPMCKLNVYDHDIRVPFFVRGPGIAANTTFDGIGSHIDIGPTVLGLAGIASPDLDGRDLSVVL